MIGINTKHTDETAHRARLTKAVLGENVGAKVGDDDAVVGFLRIPRK